MPSLIHTTLFLPSNPLSLSLTDTDTGRGRGILICGNLGTCETLESAESPCWSRSFITRPNSSVRPSRVATSCEATSPSSCHSSDAHLLHIDV